MGSGHAGSESGETKSCKEVSRCDHHASLQDKFLHADSCGGRIQVMGEMS